MLKDPEIAKEVQMMMKDPEFQRQMKVKLFHTLIITININNIIIGLY